MGQLLTTNVATNLYWFGRYLERIEAMLIEVQRSFDEIIDVDRDAGKKLYKKIWIDIDYTDSSDFLKVAILGDHNANLFDLMSYARENIIISRNQIDTEAFGAVIELHELFEKASKNSLIIDFRFIDKVLSLISEIWGKLTRKQTRNASDYFISLGKYVEKVDFHLRVDKDKDFALVLMDEIDKIVTRLAPNAKFQPHNVNEDVNTILNSINSKIYKIVAKDK
ncbi:MAG: alpha-E domain-containing protein [Epsilonproteobacteria bacterium]|nr:alpha-E domain-containing protein [Campylobacterota bacterium]